MTKSRNASRRVSPEHGPYTLELQNWTTFTALIPIFAITMPPPPSLPQNTLDATFNVQFKHKKARIISSLSAPTDFYKDASPKGNVDEEIRHLIDHINAVPELVTTSSCSGRVAIFADGDKTSTQEGGGVEGNTEGNPIVQRKTKAKGGRWLFVSHKPLDASHQTPSEFENVPGYLTKTFGMTPPSAQENTIAATETSLPLGSPWLCSPPQAVNAKYVHLKFEPAVDLTRSFTISPAIR